MYEDLDEVDFMEKYEADSDAVLLDVRTQEEWDSGYVAGAVNIDFFNPEFPNKLEELDKSKNYFVYCRSGNRSGQACQLMASKGFTGELINLQGGMLAWTGDLEV